MINKYYFNTKCINDRDHRNLRRFKRLKDNLDFDEFLVEMGVAQMGISSNQTECDAIHQLNSTSSFFPTTFHLSPNNFLKDSYIPMFALIYALKLSGLQLLNCGLANMFCKWPFHYWNADGILLAI